jgi:carbonic anhydrase
MGDFSEARRSSTHGLKVPNIVVCGHSECGAMKAAMEPNPRPDAPNLEKCCIMRTQHFGSSTRALDATLKPHDQLSQLNAGAAEHLMSTLLCAHGSGRNAPSKRLVVRHSSGDMYSYERASRSFVVIDCQPSD